MEEELLTTKDLCEWIKVAKSTITRWRRAGMPYYGKTRAYRYKKSEVLEWLKKQENEK